MVVEGEISFHFITLGNDNAGDCVYVKAGDNDILIDAGSRGNSVDDINAYLSSYVTDGKLEYVIATHADQDHIAGFSADDGVLDYYKCGIIIDFPLTDKDTKTYENYVINRDAEVSEDGATHYTALECYNNQDGAQREYQLANGISMEILYNYYYDHPSEDENNYSVCVMFKHGDRSFLFTGDLEAEGEEYLAEKYDFNQVELFKAGHHGSKTSSNDILLNEIKPKICVVTCVAGTDEYTDTIANQFPTQAFIDRISKHTDKVYVTSFGNNPYVENSEYYSMNGNIVVSSTDTMVSVKCSNNDTLLKDTEWFKNYRTCPTAWLS